MVRLLLSVISVIALAGSPSMWAATETDSVSSLLLKEVVVTDQSARNRVTNMKLGAEQIELNRLSAAPKMFGEADIIKSITLLPGIRGESDGAGGFEVRGGNAYQNLVTMDGMTLYNPAHMMGIFSTFNDDALSRATIFKGPIPQSFGEASSSVLETAMKPGDMSSHHFAGTVGLLSAKVAADGPIVKDKLSYSLAARRSYVDLFLNIIPQYKHTVMNFYDVNAKLRLAASERSTLDLSFFASRDNLAVSKLMEMKWGNIAAAINWNHRCSDRLRLATTLSVTDYTTDMATAIMDVRQSMTEYIRSFSVNEKAIYSFSDDHVIDFGLRSELLQVKSGDFYIGDLRQRETRSGWSNALWLGYDGTFFSSVNLTAGARATTFSAISAPGFHSFDALNETPPDFSAATYFHLEPRGSVKYTINDNHNLKIGASLTSQNLHGLRATTTTFPFDRYALTSSSVKPELTAQYSFGYSGMTPDGAWDWSVDAYVKSMKNVYDYRDGMTMFSRLNLESIILSGKGRSRGLEFMLRKNLGRLNGWISYTLSKTSTQIDGINGGRWYDASNDRRNDLAVVAFYRLTDKWQLSASWTFSSGRPLTAPDEKYLVDGTTCYYYTARNSYITPSSHRLDLSATYTRAGKKVTSLWSFGLYNAYAHLNPFIIYFEDDPSDPSMTRAVQQSLFGLLPSVSYTIKF